MSSQQTIRCSHCGADVSVASSAALFVTCDHCNTLLLKSDVAPQDLGRVARPAPLASRFQRGTEGRYRDASFVVRGRLQLDHGAGPWNEWAAERQDGRWLWIAEAQGETFVFEEVDAPSDVAEELRRAADRFPAHLGVRAKGEVAAGDELKLGSERWTVVEVGMGEVLTCEGELPVRPAVGSRTRYLDLGHGARAVATIDLTRAEPELLVGEAVRVDDLALDPSTTPEDGAERVEAVRVRCPECDGELVVHDLAHAVRVACAHCHVVLAPAREFGAAPSGAKGAAAQQLFTLLEAQQKVQPTSPIALGSAGTLRGEHVRVIGALGRRVRAEGRWYPWRELLLRREDGGYWWLVESQGHWLLARPVPPASVSAGGTTARYARGEFKHFTGGTAEVHWVLGEFYWRVAQGDKTEVADYVAPKLARGVSFERTPCELAASALEHLDAAEVARAFGLDRVRAPVAGVGMLQPNPARPGEAWRTSLAVLGLLIVLRVAFGAAHANEVVYDRELGPAPAAIDAETIDLSDPIELRRGPANLRIELSSPGIYQGWLGLTGALVAEDTGVVTTFAIAAQRYSGVSGGESWSEGNGEGRAWLGSVPAGAYRLRFAVQGYDTGLGRTYRVRVTSQVPRTFWVFIFVLPLIVLAVIASIRWLTFESGRWKDSDHPWGDS